MLFDIIGCAMADGGQAAATRGGNVFTSLFPILFFLVVIYLLMIRPQQKKAKQHQAMISELKKGDKVITNSGIIGVVSKIISDHEVMVEIADKVFVKFAKSSIANRTNDSGYSTSKKQQETEPTNAKENISATSTPTISAKKKTTTTATKKTGRK
ncbi:MAG: preprotein translocase subunit YajC [Holosporales bacterium]|jgi:preprotein translocase subunit YajC|nr:preprotein translocase subunit YajC [Holosporales bacterium]